MTQVGEGVAITLIRLEEGKCVFCGKKNKEREKKLNQQNGNAMVLKVLVEIL